MELLTALPSDIVALVDPTARGAAPMAQALGSKDQAAATEDSFALHLELLLPTLEGGEGLPRSGNTLPALSPVALPAEESVELAAEADSEAVLAAAEWPMAPWVVAAPPLAPPASVAADWPDATLPAAAARPEPRAWAEPALARMPLAAMPAPAAPLAAATVPPPAPTLSEQAPAAMPLTPAQATVPSAPSLPVAPEPPVEATGADEAPRLDPSRPMPAPELRAEQPVSRPASPPAEPHAWLQAASSHASQAGEGRSALRAVVRSAEAVPTQPAIQATAGSELAAPTSPEWVPPPSGASPAPAAAAAPAAAPGAAPAAAQGPPVDVRANQWHEALAGRIQWLVDQRVGEARIKLNPPELGALDVKISLVDDKTYVQLTAAHAAARDELAQSLPRLRELLTASGLEFGGASVHGGRGGQAGAGHGYEPAARGEPDWPAVAAPMHEETARPRPRGPGAIDVFA